MHRPGLNRRTMPMARCEVCGNDYDNAKDPAPEAA